MDGKDIEFHILRNIQWDACWGDGEMKTERDAESPNCPGSVLGLCGLQKMDGAMGRWAVQVCVLVPFTFFLN